MNSFYKYYGSMFMMAASIASGWAWAPSLYVSSSQAYFNGLYGLLWFTIPNVLTLVLFGYLAKKILSTTEKPDTALTLYDYISQFSIKQANLHRFVSLIVLCCSTLVQFLGLYIALHNFLGVSKVTSSLVCSVTAYYIVYKDGLKASVITDKFKYIIMVLVGAVLAYSVSSNPVNFIGYSKPTFEHVATTFGITTTLGLICAPYCDQTFWQRLYSIPKELVFKVFLLAALLFGLVPSIYGYIGLHSNIGSPNWNLVTSFSGNLFQTFILLVAILATLLSTLDSNLCALTSYTKRYNLDPRKPMIILLSLCTILSTLEITITDLFLIYGTIRGSMFVPTGLILLKMYNPDRLLWSTLAAVLIGGIGYIVTTNFMFTIIAVLLPLVGLNLTTLKAKLI